MPTTTLQHSVCVGVYMHSHAHRLSIYTHTQTVCRSDSLCKITNHHRFRPHNASVNANAAGTPPLSPTVLLKPTLPRRASARACGLPYQNTFALHAADMLYLLLTECGFRALLLGRKINMLYMLLTCFTCCYQSVWTPLSQ